MEIGQVCRYLPGPGQPTYWNQITDMGLSISNKLARAPRPCFLFIHSRNTFLKGKIPPKNGKRKKSKKKSVKILTKSDTLRFRSNSWRAYNRNSSRVAEGGASIRSSNQSVSFHSFPLSFAWGFFFFKHKKRKRKIKKRRKREHTIQCPQNLPPQRKNSLSLNKLPKHSNTLAQVLNDVIITRYLPPPGGKKRRRRKVCLFKPKK